IYGENAEANADEIGKFWRARDIANTTIKVHALKSTSRAVGAEALGALAEKLELAGKAGDEAALDAELEGLLERCRALGAALSPLYASEKNLHSGEDLPLISEDELRDAYESIREFAKNLDSDSVIYALEYLDGFRLPESDRERVKQLRRAAGTFDWDSLNTLCQ
nr:Hpt domain-containing protein [Fretibacterium sp.]